MLLSLNIHDFAIIDRIQVEFGGGMTVLTGETGAGKSILIDALAFALGERGSTKAIRSGAQRAEFSAEFNVSQQAEAQAWLMDHALDADGECLTRRVIGADGRSRAFVNGRAVTIQQLKTLGDFLVDIHGQHCHQSLTRRGIQRELLDHFGGLAAEASECRERYATYQRLADELALTAAREAEQASRIDLLRFQLDELRQLAPDAGEFTELEIERRRLHHGSRLLQGAQRAMAAISENEASNAIALLAQAQKAIDTLTALDESLSEIGGYLDAAGIQLDEAGAALTRYVASLDAEPDRQVWVDERLADLRAAARKHRAQPEALPAVLERLARELDELVNAAERGRELEAMLTAARDAYLEAARRLSARRRQAATAFEDDVSNAMQGLGMSGGRFECRIVPLDPQQPRAVGLDDIEFLISANPGQPAAPLSQVASGGELSRMSLAIQVIANDGSQIPTMIFDEVDAGVGGSVAEILGRRLADLGRSRQVLCVTHLPQVASLADRHFRIKKVTDGQATCTIAAKLSHEERIDEVARMLGGVNITATTRDHAAEMLAQSGRQGA